MASRLLLALRADHPHRVSNALKSLGKRGSTVHGAANRQAVFLTNRILSRHGSRGFMTSFIKILR